MQLLHKLFVVKCSFCSLVVLSIILLAKLICPLWKKLVKLAQLTPIPQLSSVEVVIVELFGHKPCQYKSAFKIEESSTFYPRRNVLIAMNCFAPRVDFINICAHTQKMRSIFQALRMANSKQIWRTEAHTLDAKILLIKLNCVFLPT